MTEQLQRHVCYHYNGFDEVCRKVLDVCDYEVGIHNNNDTYFHNHHRHRYFFKSGCYISHEDEFVIFEILGHRRKTKDL